MVDNLEVMLEKNWKKIESEFDDIEDCYNELYNKEYTPEFEIISDMYDTIYNIKELMKKRNTLYELKDGGSLYFKGKSGIGVM